jgi:hypothetical protein
MSLEVHGMKTIFELGSDLHKVVVIKIDFFGALIASSNIDLSIGETEIIGSFSVEIAFD